MPDHLVATKDPFASQARAAGTSSSNVFDVSRFIEALVLVDVTAIDVGATLNLTVKVSDKSDGTFHDHPTTIAQLSATGKKAYAFTNLGSHWRIDYTVAGGNVTFAVKLILKT